MSFDNMSDAVALKSQGNAAFARKDYRSAVHLYTRALTALLPDTSADAAEQTRVLLRNRSKAYFQWGHAYLAFDDIVRSVPERLSPGQRPTQRQAIDLQHFVLVLQKLESHTQVAQVYRALALAYRGDAKQQAHWTERARQADMLAVQAETKRKQDTQAVQHVNVIHHLTDSQRASLDQQLADAVWCSYRSVVPFALSDLDPKYQSAPLALDAAHSERLRRMGLELKESSLSGWGLFARRDFRAGSVLLVERPLWFATVSEDHCFHCARPLPSATAKNENENEKDEDSKTTVPGG